MNYRYDIDGLRALAILSILVFHIDPRFSGGFVGVDIFFVISGFLITSIIWRELEAQNFSFYRFYLRRARRLFPALFVTLFIVFLLVIALGLSYEVSIYGKSALSSLYYVSNIFFYTQDNYFAPTLELNPLLHTWSLSVEEQFYLIFPLFIFFIYNRSDNALKYLAVFFLLSLLLSELLVRTDSAAAFFLSPSRFWQFLTGSFIAIYSAKLSFPRKYSEIISAIGFIMISVGLFSFTGKTPFPGLFAVIPTAGTALLIIGGMNNGTSTYRILASPVPSFFGKISYSLYLWHWPLIVLYKINYTPLLFRFDKVVLFTISVLAGYVSWKFIETPARKLSLENKSTRLIFVSVFPAIVISVLSVMAIYNPEFVRKKSNFENYIYYSGKELPGKCFLRSESDFNEELCIKMDGEKNVLLVGDSHAAHYFQALKSINRDIGVSQFTSPGCPPIITKRRERRCNVIMGKVFNQIVNKYKFDVIIMAARWKPDSIAGLKETLLYLDGKAGEIIVFGPVIEYNQSLPMLLARNERQNNNKHEGMQLVKSRRLAKIHKLDSLVKKAISGTTAKFISVLENMCINGKCVTSIGDVPVSYDYGHLTTEGAELVLRRIFDRNLNLRQ